MAESPGRVLVIDDDVDMVEFLIAFLDDAGYEVLGALTSGDGLRVLEAEAPDVVLLDLGLAGSHGMDVLRRLRIARPDIPTIIMSSQAAADLVPAALERGAIDSVRKPVNPERLLHVLASALNRRTSDTTAPGRAGSS